MENNSRRPRCRPLCAISTVLGVSSVLIFAAAAFAWVSNPTLGTKESRISIMGPMMHNGVEECCYNLGALNQQEQDEYASKVHKVVIAGGISAAASLFVGVAGCIPLPGFISKRISSSPSDNETLVENEELESHQSDNNSQELSILGNSHQNDLPPSYQSITENVDTTVIGNIPPPSYEPGLGMSTTSASEDISPPSYAIAVSEGGKNTLPQSYEESVNANRGGGQSL